MTMTMEQEKRPTGRIIAIVLIALLAAGVLTYGWTIFTSGPDAEGQVDQAPVETIN